MRAALLIAAAAACSAGPPGPGLDVDRALGHAAALVALGPRPGDSAASAAAADYIARALEAGGARVERVPVGTVELPAIHALGRTFREPRTAVTRDPDLVVHLGPPGGPGLLVMAHYDTVPGSPGAIDNAVAVGVLIELARALRAAPPPAPVAIAFPANEEIGLVGAEAYARGAGAGDIAFAIALDLVGGSGPLSLNGASRLIGLRELRWLAAAADRAGIALRAPLAHRVVSRWWPQLERSDHGPFTQRGIRAVHFYHRGQHGEHIDLAYHSARDTLDRVDRRSVDELGRLLHALATSPVPAASGGDDGFWVPAAVNTAWPRWALIAAELALAGLSLALLLRPARRGSPSPRTPGRLSPGAIAGIVCYALAALAAYAVERAAAGAHPAPWLHAPLRSAIAGALVLAGALALATRLAARIAPWTGERRYLALAIAVPLVLGASLLLAGAAELAWIWLVPAAGIALASRLGRARGIALAWAALPPALLLDPALLREVAWNGFLPEALPLALWIALFGIPLAATAAWLARSRPPAGPLGTAILAVGSGLAILVGSVMLARYDPPCSPSQFKQIHLACESIPGLH